MKLQGSEARGIKTLQSKNSPHRQMRFWLKRLANLHGRLIKGVAVWELPTLSAAYFTNLGHLDAVSLFAEGIKAAAIVAAGAKGTVPAIADFVRDRRSAKRKHAVSYLVGITRK
ncbi:hypothetical protein ABIF74_011821 [Bradyrhizobium japonicum]